MKRLNAQKLSLIFGGGIVAISVVGFIAAAFGLTLPLAIEGASAAAGMIAGAKLA